MEGYSISDGGGSEHLQRKHEEYSQRQVLEMFLAVQLSIVVEVEDVHVRQERVNELYNLADEGTLSLDAINFIYDTAINNMVRRRTQDDKKLYTVVKEPGRRRIIQVWPAPTYPRNNRPM
jgi:hypothetical protein